MKTTIKQLAALSTALILLVLFWFLYIVLGALGFDTALALLSSFLVCVLLVPFTWHFAKQEATLMNGGSDAERKNTK